MLRAAHKSKSSGSGAWNATDRRMWLPTSADGASVDRNRTWVLQYRRPSHTRIFSPHTMQVVSTRLRGEVGYWDRK
jgi:hypothetical protein